ncbi:MAG: hypothetical protein QNI84_00085 [Henriciella sp.]|nr:hypothetical protein [Henriciella sp.]
MTDQALFALLHVLVFVYWLGGDLGAFYTSRFLTQPNVTADRRLMAAKIVGDVDMAPRTALILALPTGLLLAESNGWLSLGWPVIGAIVVASLAWLAIAWKLHLDHGGSAGWVKALDSILRYGLLLSLIGISGLAFSPAIELPLFLTLKLLALAGCVALGLYIRVVLKPLGPALAGLTGSDSANSEAVLARTLQRARPLVTGIWVLLIFAAFLGLWTPTSF